MFSESVERFFEFFIFGRKKWRIITIKAIIRIITIKTG